MKQLNLATRLALGFLLVAVLPLAGLAWFYLDSFERALRQTVLQNISSIANKKADQIDTFIHERLEDVQSLGHNRLVRQAMQDLGRTGQPGREARIRAYQDELAALINGNYYHDLLLIAPDGLVLFSLRQESDLGTNLNHGPYQHTGLAMGFRQAMASLHTDLTPFEAYAPSASRIAGFLVVPLMQQGKPMGALALQLNLETLTPVVADRTGLGSSGETVLGQRQDDHLLYTGPLRQDEAAAFLRTQPLEQMSTPMSLALAGGHGRGLAEDYRGTPVAAAWRYLPALRWGMVVKIDAAEAFLPAHRARHTTALALGLFLLLSGAAALILGRRFLRSEGIIAAQEARYRAIFSHMNDGVALYRPTADLQEFTFLDFNQAAERITGIPRQELLGRRLGEVFPGMESAGILPAMRRVATNGGMESVVLARYQDAQRDIWVENDLVRLPGGDVLSVFRDVTARRQAEAALRLYANVFAHSGEALMVTDEHNRILTVNPAFTRLTGYPLAEIEGRNPSLLASGYTPQDTYSSLWSTLAESGFWQGELWDRHRDGGIYPKWAAISVIRDEAGKVTHHIASFTDISERKAAEERIAHLAHHDTLTGLLNRYSLENRLVQALLGARRDGRKLAVLFIDMDRFKVINDTLGHHIGDLLLIQVAQRLHATVRESDIVARLGGDEFVVVLTGLENTRDVTSVTAKILTSLGQPYPAETHTLHSTPSIGVSIFPADGEDAETLMKNADTAMYHAKEQGRNNVQYFTAALNAAAAERLELERDLRAALLAGQFELHYQPQVMARSGELNGFEALVRWRHPDKGLIPPVKFIPIAEETGLIEPLGDWILGEACRQLAEWRARHPGFARLRMAVNLSAHQLRALPLVEQVRSHMQRHGMGEGDLELEITETVAMHNPEQAINQLQALRLLGVQLAIDDFGTGYSSLAYLKRLPIQVLKLDREFVRDMESDANDAAISTATLALAHSLGLRVVAEGVENRHQRDFLVAHQCDLLQGYGIAPPMPAAEVVAWVAARPLLLEEA